MIYKVKMNCNIDNYLLEEKLLTIITAFIQKPQAIRAQRAFEPMK